MRGDGGAPRFAGSPPSPYSVEMRFWRFCRFSKILPGRPSTKSHWGMGATGWLNFEGLGWVSLKGWVTRSKYGWERREYEWASNTWSKSHRSVGAGSSPCRQGEWGCQPVQIQIHNRDEQLLNSYLLFLWSPTRGCLIAHILALKCTATNCR